MVGIDLEGKYILTTGGLGAIAESVSRRLIEAGATLLITDVVPQREAEARLASWGRPSDQYFYSPMDVTSENAVASTIHGLAERFPAMDCVVSLAGGCALHPFATTTSEEYGRIFDYNYMSHVRIARTVTRLWAENKTAGHFIFTSSLVGSLPWVDLTAYAPAKAALEMLAKCLALEFANQGMRFNCVAPGHVATGSSLKVYDEDAEYRRLVDSAIPLKRLIRPESIADAFLWLSSSLAQDVNGQIIKVDCGASIPKVG
jgi:NAD(P)-dependent dehydrogenase (short-subunit alcohol dehydrogenase family)